MVMFLVLRTFHKLADLHGLTAFFHLPSCDEDLAEDKEPIVEECREEEPPEVEKAVTKPLDPSSHVSYNSFSR